MKYHVFNPKVCSNVKWDMKIGTVFKLVQKLHS